MFKKKSSKRKTLELKDIRLANTFDFIVKTHISTQCLFKLNMVQHFWNSTWLIHGRSIWEWDLVLRASCPHIGWLGLCRKKNNWCVSNKSCFLLNKFEYFAKYIVSFVKSIVTNNYQLFFRTCKKLVRQGTLNVRLGLNWIKL